MTKKKVVRAVDPIQNMNKQQQEELVEDILRSVSVQTLGHLIEQMGTLVIKPSHRRQVIALVDALHRATDEMPSNFVALASVIFAEQSVAACLSIGHLMIKADKSTTYLQGLMNQASQFLELHNRRQPT